MARLFKRGALVAISDRQFSVRISFQVEKGSTKEANKGQVSLYNLSDDSRGFVERSAKTKTVPGQNLRLIAGYDDQLALLFSGNISRVANSRSGPDLVTTIECGDGEVALQNSYIILSYKEGVSEATIIRAAIEALKALGLREGSIETFAAREYKSGFAYSGSAGKLLERLAKNQGMEFSIQDGLIQIIKIDSSTKESAIDLNENTGLVGFPTKTNEGFQAKSLLNPAIRPGRKAVLTSTQTSLNGTYLIRKVVHQGDTLEGDFSTSMEGKLLG